MAERCERHPLGCGLLAVDEATMVDAPLMRALLEVTAPEGLDFRFVAAAEPEDAARKPSGGWDPAAGGE